MTRIALISNKFFLFLIVIWFVDGAACCDLFHGSWIYDGAATPRYNVSMCPFVEKQFDCIGNGRPDKLYLNYRWKPAECELPKFRGKDFLRRFRGKRIMLVGDSLSLNQWQSLTCMLHVSVSQSNYTLTRRGGVSTFYISEYDISLMFSRNALLVDTVVDGKKGRILKLDSVEMNARSWKGFHMLIFNSWHWWLHKGSKTPWDYIQVGDKVYKDMDRLRAFGMGLRTWSNWLDSNINPSQTKVFFQGISPTHYNGAEWKNNTSSNGATCHGETKPIGGSLYPGPVLPAVAVVKGVLSKMKTKVQLLDVTTLSALRKDGHPSVYGQGGSRENDCSHWCLAGVPDTWNNLLYAILISNQKSKIVL